MKTKYLKGEEEVFKQLLQNKLSTAKKVVLTSHKGPDDDSISSILGLFHFIRTTYPHLEIVITYASMKVTRWSYFEGYSEIGFELDPGEVHDADLVVMTDACQWSRVSQQDVIPARYAENVLAIDHHKNDPDEGIQAYVDDNACSCAELIYRLFFSESAISTRLGEILLLGMIGDSGSFTYVGPHQTDIFVVAERIVREAKVNIQAMKATYQQYSMATYRLLAFLMNRTTFEENSHWGKYSYSWLSKEEGLSFTDSEVELKAAADIYINTYAKSVLGTTWGFLIYPSLSQGNYNLTLRSLPNGVNVRQLAVDLLSGGGHTLAAGGKFPSSDDIESAINKVKSFLQSNIPAQIL